ncbi:hypothetical protein GINT2_002179 [Glugoides intestinalis]
MLSFIIFLKACSGWVYNSKRKPLTDNLLPNKFGNESLLKYQEVNYPKVGESVVLRNDEYRLIKVSGDKLVLGDINTNGLNHKDIKSRFIFKKIPGEKEDQYKLQNNGKCVIAEGNHMMMGSCEDKKSLLYLNMEEIESTARDNGNNLAERLNNEINEALLKKISNRGNNRRDYFPSTNPSVEKRLFDMYNKSKLFNRGNRLSLYNPRHPFYPNSPFYPRRLLLDIEPYTSIENESSGLENLSVEELILLKLITSSKNGKFTEKDLIDIATNIELFSSMSREGIHHGKEKYLHNHHYEHHNHHILELFKKIMKRQLIPLKKKISKQEAEIRNINLVERIMNMVKLDKLKDKLEHTDRDVQELKKKKSKSGGKGGLFGKLISKTPQGQMASAIAGD